MSGPVSREWKEPIFALENDVSAHGDEAMSPPGIGREHIRVTTAQSTTSTAVIPTPGRNTMRRSRPASVAGSGCARWPTLACRPKHIDSTTASPASRETRRGERPHDWRTEHFGLGSSSAEGRTIAAKRGRRHRRWYCRFCRWGHGGERQSLRLGPAEGSWG